MTVRLFLIGSIATTFTGAVIWLLIISQLDPDRAGALGYILFFLSLFIAASGLASLLGYFVRRIISRNQFLPYTVRASLRQGIMISTFFTVLIILQFIHLYRWWLAIILVVLFVSFELIFLSYDRSYLRRNISTQEPGNN